MKKYDIYEQINFFKKELAPKLHQNTPKQLEKYTFYVSDDEAKDKASFISFLIKEELFEKEYNTIIDLAFGSGNLSSHIILENDISYEHIIFNDINKNYTNQKITDLYINSKITQKNILDETEFSDIEADLVILNPQVSGNYEGDISKIDDYEHKLSKLINYFYNQGANLIFYGIEKNFNAFFKDKFSIRYITNNNQLYIVNKNFITNRCYEQIEGTFEHNEDCISTNFFDNKSSDINTLMSELNAINLSSSLECFSLKKLPKFTDIKEGELNFSYMNILFKGVPGTGKSRAINEIIENNLKLAKNHKNVLRINIHSASSNSDLMQGIGISTSDKGNIIYSEKQGLILDIIKRATFHPNQPFVLILEEIQENSLNELIGDLIYLIEEEKRARLIADNKEYDSYEELVDKLVDEDDTLDYVEIPYLVNDSTKYKKMIMPNNLFIFCTSNYRDDKKVIEDNLLRRFEVIEIYPKETIVNDYAKDFFDKLNRSINAVMEKQGEIHPDRFLIGHAIWKDVENKELFYKAFSKLITEFKDIREIEFDVFKSIIEGITLPEDVSIEIENSYYKMIKDIQLKINYDFLS